jgi:hypothetical protein
VDLILINLNAASLSMTPRCPHLRRHGETARCPIWVIRDQIEPTASPAKSAMPPKAEANQSIRDHQDMSRSRGGLTSKIHAVVDTNGLPVR